MRKIGLQVIAVVLALTMMMGMTLNVSAAGEGKLTINNTTAGQTIELYQLFTATKNGTAIAYSLNTKYEGFFTSNAKYECQDLTGEELSAKAYEYVHSIPEGEDRVTFAKEALLWILKQQSITADKSSPTSAESTTITELDYGYYLVYPRGATDTSGDAPKSPAMLVSVLDTEASITMKSTYPTVDKVIVGEADAEKKAGDFNVGDIVNFKLTSKVPDMTGYTSYTFNFKDTLSDGLTFNENSVVVKIGTQALTLDTDYTVTRGTQEGEPTVTITLNNFINQAEKAGQPIVVTYSATLNENASVGMDKNTNTAIVEYSNNPGQSGSVGESTPSEADAHSFDFTIFKYHGEQSALSGAKFKLFSDSECLNEVKLEEVGASSGTYIKKEAGTATITSDADGKVQVKGLAAGTYYLQETEAPAGYNKLTAPVIITITPTYAAVGGALEKVDVKYSYNGTENTSTINTESAPGTSPEVPIENKSGAELPSTGGKGTILFTIGGVLILSVMLTASIVSKKRKKG